ncbi:hypothetical protein I302_104320 [Kwoniella bestiolae CBS 10118]|uniref:2-dehydropantoate 2-reductase n=1 Tax=Kwoniella bestiolae CBS 10118 TaxID=1296100 RepID=A0A1B9GAY3_9TREE|nr:hypothetical protein I302_03028 [Kwoniella bestiolae CBS 10118]OCF28177.1 hypothetical protein I302_03028 [Kwoniella bestiolae CBS 10118]
MTNAVSSNGVSPSEPVDILLIGLGSIGSVYAYLLERSGKARVTAVARSNYELYTTTGVTLHTDRFGIIEGWKPYKVVRSQAEALANGQRYAICVVCTKCLPDVLPNSVLLKEAIESGQIGSWNLIQNGLGIEEDLYQAVKHLGTPVMSSPAWIGIVTEGSLVRWRGKDTLVTGLYPPLPAKETSSGEPRIFTEREKDALKLWVDLLTAGEGYVHPTDHIDSIRFSKNVWNCAWAVVTGLIRHTALQFSYLSPTEEGYIKDYFMEIVDTGFKSGLLYEGMVQYPAGDTMGDAKSVVDRAWTVLTGTARERGVGHKYSLLIDVEQNRPFEVEVIVGSVLNIAKENNLVTPRLEFAYAMLKALQLEIIRDNDKKKVKKADEVGA